MPGEDKHQRPETSGVTCRAIGEADICLPKALAVVAFKPGNCKLYPDRAIADWERPEPTKVTAAKNDIPAFTHDAAKVMLLLFDDKRDFATCIVSALILITCGKTKGMGKETD